MTDLEELRFFGKLVQRGVLRKEQVEELMARAQEDGSSLTTAALAAGVLDEERLQRLRLLEGDDLPPIPGYEFLGLAGRGGTAYVVHARHRKSGEDVAIKVLLPELEDLPEASRAFQREAKLLCELRHENVVQGQRFGRFEGHTLLLMEWVPGRSLLQRLRDGETFDEDTALGIVLQVARGLQFLSDSGIVHRDIKPDNILLTDEHEVKLIDLGFATSGPADDSETTVGTAAYISPEQASGKGDLDVRSDIYSLGATLYQLVVGELPFSGEDNQELLARHILESLSSEVLKSRRISPHMHYFIEKMMAKDRAIRYQSPVELIEDIEQQIAGKKSARFNPRDEPEAKPPPKPAESTAPPKYPVIRRRRRN